LAREDVIKNKRISLVVTELSEILIIKLVTETDKDSLTASGPPPDEPPLAWQSGPTHFPFRQFSPEHVVSEQFGPKQMPLPPQSLPMHPTPMHLMPLQRPLPSQSGPMQPDVKQPLPIQTPLRQLDPIQPNAVQSSPKQTPL
jgi:hypothetical protein